MSALCEYYKCEYFSYSIINEIKENENENESKNENENRISGNSNRNRKQNESITNMAQYSKDIESQPLTESQLLRDAMIEKYQIGYKKDQLNEIIHG